MLLVEDDADLADAVAAALEDCGCRVYAARDQDEAVAAARAWRPDAVVADLVGVGDLARLAALGLPLVLSSGSSETYLAAAARRLGAEATLRKPYDLADLIRLVRRFRRPAA